MIGCHAEAASTNINMDTEEMTDVKWFTREEVLLALEGKNENLRVPMKIAIAHHLLKTERRMFFRTLRMMMNYCINLRKKIKDSNLQQYLNLKLD